MTLSNSIELAGVVGTVVVVSVAFVFLRSSGIATVMRPRFKNIALTFVLILLSASVLFFGFGCGYAEGLGKSSGTESALCYLLAGLEGFLLGPVVLVHELIQYPAISLIAAGVWLFIFSSVIIALFTANRRKPNEVGES